MSTIMLDPHVEHTIRVLSRLKLIDDDIDEQTLRYINREVMDSVSITRNDIIKQLAYTNRVIKKANTLLKEQR